MNRLKKTRYAAGTTTCQTVEEVPLQKDIALTSQEEKVLRMHYGLPIDNHAPLNANGVHPAAAATINQLELLAYQSIVGSSPEHCVKADIIRKLRDKSCD